jgi:hypothetical protein
MVDMILETQLVRITELELPATEFQRLHPHCWVTLSGSHCPGPATRWDIVNILSDVELGLLVNQT